MASMSISSSNIVDDEWEKFISTDYENSSDNEETHINYANNDEIVSNVELFDNVSVFAPKATDIYISTKSKIAYLNKEINLKEIFWKVPVIPYATPENGVIKKLDNIFLLIVAILSFNSLSS